MTKTILNFWLDVLLLVTFLLLIFVAVVTRFVFPVHQAPAGWHLWGLSFSAWFDFQFAILCAFVAEILLHVTLHWPWVCGVIGQNYVRSKKRELQDDGIRTIYGVGFMIVLLNLLGIAIAAAAIMVQAPPP